MTETTEKLVRRADVPGFDDTLDERWQRVLGRLLARIETMGVSPEKAELLRREVLDEYRDELVPDRWAPCKNAGRPVLRWLRRLGEIDREEFDRLGKPDLEEAR